jgi:lipopolysaccharide transport system ATP-binding protein
MMESNTALKITNLGKKYTIGIQKEGSLRSTLANIFKSSAKSGEDFWAMRNVSFEVPKGEVVGVIGKNGAGKSTLLKLISQITKPTEGKIEINGRVASLLEVGTGFHPELTGRENIFLNGTILGMSRKEVKAKFDEIVAFSGIEKFIDTPVKRYSSGMYVRLAFAVAAHLEPEILIIDEVLAVGDAEFQKKCLGKMKDVAGEGRTVIFVSHDMGAISSLCSSGIYLGDGEIIGHGSIHEVIHQYLTDSVNRNNRLEISKGMFDLSSHSNKKYKSQFGMQTIQLLCNGVPSSKMISGCNMDLIVEINNEFPDEYPVFGFVIKDETNSPIAGLYNLQLGDNNRIEEFKNAKIKINIPFLPIYGNGSFFIDLFFGNKIENYDIILEAVKFDLETSNVYNSAKLLDINFNKIIIQDVSMEFC